MGNCLSAITGYKLRARAILRSFLDSVLRSSLGGILLAGLVLPAPFTHRTVQAAPGTCNTQTVRVSLADEQISFCAPTGQPFLVVQDGDSVPEIPYAQLNQENGYGILNVKAIAPGSTPGFGRPVYKPGQLGAYQKAVRNLQSSQKNQQTSSGPDAILWDETVQGLQVDGSRVVSSINGLVTSIEWDMEHAGRLWSISMAWDSAMPNADEWLLAAQHFSIQTAAPASLPDTAIDLGAAFLAEKNAPQVQELNGFVDPVGTPSWWSGVCDDNNYYPYAGVHSTLLTTWKGVAACGPRTYLANHPVQFFSGAWGQIEFECVELVMRFLFQEWGIYPWPGNANQIKDRFTSSLLAFYPNNGSKALTPGDILTEDASTSNPYGHTMIISGVSLDGSATGTISILEQNSSNGSRSLNVNKGVVQPDAWTGLVVQGWLHVSSNTLTPTATPTQTMTFTPTPLGPAAPLLVSPENHRVITNLVPWPDWSDSVGADHYQLQLSTSSSFSTLALDQNNIQNSSYPLTVPLAPATTYYWKVRAFNSLGQPGSWSDFWDFTTPSATLTPTPLISATPSLSPTQTPSPTLTPTPPPSIPAVPVQITPSNHNFNVSCLPLLDWGDVTWTVQYQLQVATNSSFSPTTILDQLVIAPTSSYQISTALTPSVTYFWRVKAINSLGQSAWSTIWDFYTVCSTATSTSTPTPTPTRTNTALPTNTSTTTPIPSATTVSTSTPTRTNTAFPSSTPTGTLKPSATTVLPGKPALAYPIKAQLITNSFPRLDWLDASGADHYRLQISTNSTFASPLWLDQDGILVSGYSAATALAPDTTYYWRVQAINSQGLASAWAASSFRVAILPPGLSAPAKAVSLDNKRPVFSWIGVSGATSYTLEVSTSSAFSGTAISVKTTSWYYAPTADLAASTKYYWRVRANGPNGPRLSQVWTFKTGKPPSVPALLSPAANALVAGYTPLLDWSNSSLPTGTLFAYYQVQVSDVSAFTAPVVDSTGVTGRTVSQLTSPALAAGRTYYWRVRAVNTIAGIPNFSTWSAIRSFRTP